ncbi:hypothetical protein [Alkalinema sp. FACHB-956]|uniref:hypothetical protein n=1 Tax=Alkalinema sp. FACHB-956 TaxID=2692768 RepID=UPI001687D41B|nr:hypothetical protein [Alkalinema sp. FACHB-956]MBD2325678.1 hypothetical protein [Alkalinema sp. FACHB-956]
MGKRKQPSQPNSQEPQKISSTERGIALGLVCVVVIVFIFVLLYPTAMDSGKLAIVRFFAAFLSGLSGYLFAGDLGLEARLPISKVTLRATGAFAAFVIVLSLFFVGLPNPDNTNKINPGSSIKARYLTTVNDYPTLALTLLKPSINDKFISAVLSEILGTERTPAVYTKSPAFESIEKFKLETGNEKTIHEQNRYQYLLYKQGSEALSSIKAIDLAKKQPSKRNFQMEMYKGEDSTYAFHYAPVSLPLQQNEEDSKFTIILKRLISQSKKDSLVAQFPQLSAFSEQGIRDDYSYKFSPSLKSDWIEKIIRNNPNFRGFFTFLYPYAKNLNEVYQFLLGCRETRDLIDRLMPSPYVKFLDIENTSEAVVRLDSISVQEVQRNPYELTTVDNREKVFQVSSRKSLSLDMSVAPKEHLFIPVEFGFDTSSQTKKLKSFYEVSTDEYKRDLKLTQLYMAQPTLEQKYNSLCGRGLKSIESSIECLKTLSSSMSFTQSFVEKIESLDRVLERIPKQIAVGSIWVVESISINNANIKIPSPKQEPPFLIQAVFNEGSCPYLLVYNPEKKDWVEFGTIITGRNSKSLQGYDELFIGQPSGENIRIKIEEREKEISYIDSIALAYIDPSTNDIRRIYSTQPNLSKVDGQYIVLEQGKSLELSFKNLIPPGTSNIKLEVNGYYKVVE